MNQHRRGGKLRGAAPNSSSEGLCLETPPGVPSRAAAHTDLLPLKVLLLTVALVVVVVPMLNPIRPASPREATSSPQTVWPRRYSHQGAKEKMEAGRRPLREEGRLDTCSLGWGSRPLPEGWYTAGSSTAEGMNALSPTSRATQTASATQARRTGSPGLGSIGHAWMGHWHLGP